jgi:hypothetical protein
MAPSPSRSEGWGKEPADRSLRWSIGIIHNTVSDPTAGSEKSKMKKQGYPRLIRAYMPAKRGHNVDLLTVLNRELAYFLGYDPARDGLIGPTVATSVREMSTVVLDQALATP